MTRAAVPIETFFSPARTPDGAVLADGFVFAYIYRATDAVGAPEGRRARLWQDPDRAAERPFGMFGLDGSGMPKPASAAVPFRGVCGDGVLLLRFYAAGTTKPPDDSQIDDLSAYPASREENFYPGGTYRITRPLLIRRVYQELGSRFKNYGYATIELVGEARGYIAGGQEVILFADFLDGPAIAIQTRLGVMIRETTGRSWAGWGPHGRQRPRGWGGSRERQHEERRLECQ